LEQGGDKTTIVAPVMPPFSKGVGGFKPYSNSDISTGFTRGYSDSASSMQKSKTKKSMQKMQKIFNLHFKIDFNQCRFNNKRFFIDNNIE